MRRSTRPRRRSRRCGPALRALGPAPADGPWAAPPVAPGRRPPATGPTGIATGVGGHGSGRRLRRVLLQRPGASADCPALGRRAARSTTASSAAIDDDLDMPVGAGRCSARSLRAPLTADERRWLVLDADCGPGARPRPGLGRRRRPRPSRPPTSPPRSRTLVDARGGGPRGARLRPRPTRSAPSSTGSAGSSIDGPDGPTVRRTALTGRAGLSRGRSAGRGAAEAVDDPVEVALAQPVALGLGQARVAAMLVAHAPAARRRATARRDRLVVLVVAQDEAPPDVEVAVEAEALVERTARDGVRAAERQQVALDRVDVAGRRVLEPAQVVRDDAPTRRRPRPSGRRGRRRAASTTSPVGSTLVSRTMTTGPCARRIPMFSAAPWPSRVLVRTTSTSIGESDAAASDSMASSASSCSGDGPSATMTTDVPAGALAVRPSSPGEVVREVRRDETTVAIPLGASSRRDGTLALDP